MESHNDSLDLMQINDNTFAKIKKLSESQTNNV